MTWTGGNIIPMGVSWSPIALILSDMSTLNGQTEVHWTRCTRCDAVRICTLCNDTYEYEESFSWHSLSTQNASTHEPSQGSYHVHDFFHLNGKLWNWNRSTSDQNNNGFHCKTGVGACVVVHNARWSRWWFMVMVGSRALHSRVTISTDTQIAPIRHVGGVDYWFRFNYPGWTPIGQPCRHMISYCCYYYYYYYYI